MKKTARKLLLVLCVTIVSFFSCKKEVFHSAANEQMIASVNTWLQKQHDAKKPNSSKNLDILQAHLNFAAMEEIKYERGSTVVIPIGNEYRSIAKIGDGPILNLVALVNKDGSIRSVHVAAYTAPKDQQVTALLAATFHNIYHTADNVTDGQYQFLSPAGTREYQLEYKNGRMASEGRYTTHPKNSSPVQTNGVRVNAVCTDWYLTTTYYVDGAEVGETEEYLGRTCSGGGLSDEPGDFGDGGDTNYEYAKRAMMTFDLSTLFAIGYATTYGCVTLSFTAENSVFTAASAGTSYANGLPGGWTYTHVSSSATITDPTTVSASGSGTFKDQYQQSYGSSKTQNFSYALVFP